jgi:catechol 2,3-dioxygenase-like lactoylglutathione lyase family enzyme
MKNNWEHSHTGVFTKDFERTLKYYENIGIASPPLPKQPHNMPGKLVNIEFGKVTGPFPPGLPFELLYIGDLELEVLHAPVKRPQGEALAYGEGVNHVCFNVTDIDGETDKLVTKGLRIIQDAKLDGVRIEDYLDTREYGNILLSFRPMEDKEAKLKKAGYGTVDWKYQGVGAVVKDLEKTFEYYRSFGITTFQSKTLWDSTLIKDIKVYGKPSKDRLKAKVGLMYIGPVEYELIEPLEGQAIYKESLERRGEGVINLTFKVNNLALETTKLVEKGVSVVLRGISQTGKDFSYFDTRNDGGDIMIKLVQN